MKDRKLAPTYDMSADAEKMVLFTLSRRLGRAEDESNCQARCDVIGRHQEGTKNEILEAVGLQPSLQILSLRKEVCLCFHLYILTTTSVLLDTVIFFFSSPSKSHLPANNRLRLFESPWYR